MAKVKREGYMILYILTVVSVLAAILTVIPDGSADELCRLGYKAHCSYTPISTAICIAIAGIACLIRKRFFTKST